MELQVIQNRIYEIRGCRVMMDFDLAEMYQIATKRLKEQVKRNIERFPADFMFELSISEYNSLRSQIATLEIGRGKHSKYLPFAFTEQGVAMLSSILKSEIAIEINISIMRAFIKIRELTIGYTDLKSQLDNFMLETNMQFNEVYQALTELAEQKKLDNKPMKPIGYQHYNRD